MTRDTLEMLHRLENLLMEYAPTGHVSTHHDATQLRRISMTLHRWHELECNEDVQRENGKVYITRQLNGARTYKYSIPDRERGAEKRLAAIMANYPKLSAYVQTDPRGAALYILKPGDVPQGADVSAYYSRGVAVHQ